MLSDLPLSGPTAQLSLFPFALLFPDLGPPRSVLHLGGFVVEFIKKVEQVLHYLDRMRSFGRIHSLKIVCSIVSCESKTVQTIDQRLVRKKLQQAINLVYELPFRDAFVDANAFNQSTQSNRAEQHG